MPEQISKYPDVTLQILREAGAVCGAGAVPKILTGCPPERFCSLPTGEVCIYGIAEIPTMTQVTPQEVARVVCPDQVKPRSDAVTPSVFDGMLWAGLFLAGLVAGRWWRSSSKL